MNLTNVSYALKTNNRTQKVHSSVLNCFTVAVTSVVRTSTKSVYK